MHWLDLPQRVRLGALRISTFRLDLCFCAALAGIVWLAYEPSLKHAPRSDQWCFLVDTMPYHDFFEILKHSYSYNRTRTVMPGDTDLFRPVLFTLLAAEKAAFEGNLGAHQTVGIVLHCIVCFLLLFLLRAIASYAYAPSTSQSDEPTSPFKASNLLPYGLVAFFALNPAVQELVIWSHLGGYLLFLAFVLGSTLLLLHFVKNHEQRCWSSPTLWCAWILALLAAFTHELGQVYAVLAGLFLAVSIWPKSKARATCLVGAFAAILVMYQMANAIDRRVHADQFVPDSHRALVEERALTSLTAPHVSRFAAYTVLQPFFPTMLTRGYCGDRWCVAELVNDQGIWCAGVEKCAWGGIVSLAVFGLIAAVVALGLYRAIRFRQQRPICVFLLFAGLYAIYAAITVLGRMNVRLVPEVLSSNSYYAYFGLLFAIPAGYAICQCPGAGSRIQSQVFHVTVLAGLFVLAGCGAVQVWQANQIITHASRDLSTPIRTLHKFVEQHRNEADFSLVIDYDSSDYIPQMHERYVTDIVFAHWLSSAAKYRVAIRDRKVHILPGDGSINRRGVLSAVPADAKIPLSTRRGG